MATGEAPKQSFICGGPFHETDQPVCNVRFRRHSRNRRGSFLRNVWYFGAVGRATGSSLPPLSSPIVVSFAIKVADQWNRAVVLRLGRFRALKGPGLFFIIPVIDTIPYWIDIRVITSSFMAERTLTKDTVPVNVDAVLFWKVVDPKKAALDVADYQSAINWAAQTALRDVIGKTILSDMLEGREKISIELQKIIDTRTEPWGIDVISVEVKDVLIPPALEDAMSMQAQAERERQARVILGDSRAADCGEIRRGREHLCEQSDRVPFARDEHAVRGAEAEFHHRDCAQYGGRQHATRWHCRTDGADDGTGPPRRQQTAIRRTGAARVNSRSEGIVGFKTGKRSARTKGATNVRL